MAGYWYSSGSEDENSMKSYIPIEKEELPESFEIDLANETFILEFNYNETGDFFSVDLFDLNENPIVIGEKLILGVPLWEDLQNANLPAPTLVPLDESKKETRITHENFGVTVFLYIDDGDENE